MADIVGMETGNEGEKNKRQEEKDYKVKDYIKTNWSEPEFIRKGRPTSWNRKAISVWTRKRVTHSMVVNVHDENLISFVEHVKNDNNQSWFHRGYEIIYSKQCILCQNNNMDLSWWELWMEKSNNFSNFMTKH